MPEAELTETADYDKSADPTAHASSHESAGSDELDVTGLIFKSCVIINQDNAQTINNAATTLIDWESETLDRANDFNLTNNRFTAPEDGVYHIISQITIDELAADKNADIRPYINGAFDKLTRQYIAAAGDVHPQISFIAELSANDYVEIKVRHTHGATRDTVPGTVYTWAMFARLY